MKLRCAGPRCSVLSPALRLQLGDQLGDDYCLCKEALERADYLQLRRQLRPRRPLVGVAGGKTTA